MPSNIRYAPIPNPHTDPNAQDEMEAAFLESDDEDDHDHNDRNHVRATDATRNGYASLPNAEPESLSSPSREPGASQAYDFERAEYGEDWARPPPGSPPASTQFFQVQSQGNNNGIVPDFSAVARSARNATGGWARRVLPQRVAERLGVGSPHAEGAIGGGTQNDGVFANVTAKPSRPVRVTEGDNTYLVPEESQKDAPPSYASAQADAVPPYWETTIHAPASGSGPGDVMIESLPTGSLFSFLWNMLVSISFQFVGFLLTYLLHTTHAAKLGSRAGLGITLIQYGFAMRGRAEEWGKQEEIDGWGWQSTEQDSSTSPAPTFATAAEAEDYYGKLNANGTVSWPAVPVGGTTTEGTTFLGDATTEWLSFFLMTVGWFILLTSLLSFWRVKRWERGILASQPPSTLPAPGSSSASPSTLFQRLSMLRTGLGFPQRRAPPDDLAGEYPGALSTFGMPVPDEDEDAPVPERSEYIIPLDPDNPEANDRLARAYAEEARLQRALRAAGLL
ncbi:metal homeostatis BSD2 family protein [Phanerochaete sordida]|uniref:Metal homeostatis BSD2 family protein n=1 Tax=Phanerochaete sordida TaxID=48140 RepID=A0A9P3FWW1_9APHY|nr:metal homeostatis BSD2 family protein [Phanerochaete sordida]